MVLRKRLYQGFNGYQIPDVPRAPRSVRRRGPLKKPVEDHQICAFELLAAVAGKLLQETESSASSNASHAKDLLGIHLDDTKQEQVEDTNIGSRSDCLDQGSCVESIFIHELAAKELNFRPTMEDLPMAENHLLVGRTSDFTRSNSLKKVDCELNLGMCHGGSENGTRKLEEEISESKNLTVANTCNAKKSVDKCMKSEPVINSDSSVQLPLYRDRLPSASFPKHRNNVNLGIRDDGENSFRCNKFSTKIRALRPQPRNSYRRIRKMLTSKYWKMASKLKDYDLSNTNGELRPFFHSRKVIRLRDRHRCEAPSKRRKLCGCRFAVAYDQEASSESISNSPEKRSLGEECISDTILLRGNGVSNSVKVHKKPKDSKVKFGIKSFKVPELYIEVPESATVGSLKRTVLETLTAILGGGLRVGIVLQGKKVRDDNRTLQQAGISPNGNLDTLRFMLEPSLTPVAGSPKASPHLFQCEIEQKLLRSPASPIMDSGLSNASFGPPLKTTKMVNQQGSNKEILPSAVDAADTLTSEAIPDSKALVPALEMNAEALAVVPMSQKTKHCETTQRRTRRPFSVTEVEGLVEAVEILGTGRWRDVKMRTFDNADHRTYVDLKDKWKTLVHTASISPQQRRGEPVPQELLDRVLSADAYWSQQHLTKQHGKHQAEPLKIMNTHGKPLEA